jgi:hypothetical protein
MGIVIGLGKGDSEKIAAEVEGLYLSLVPDRQKLSSCTSECQVIKDNG